MDFLETKAIRIAMTTRTPKTIPAITTPFTADFPASFPLLFDCLLARGGLCTPGGGGGADPDDQEFPPVLKKKIIAKSGKQNDKYCILNQLQL